MTQAPPPDNRPARLALLLGALSAAHPGVLVVLLLLCAKTPLGTGPFAGELPSDGVLGLLLGLLEGSCLLLPLDVTLALCAVGYGTQGVKLAGEPGVAGSGRAALGRALGELALALLALAGWLLVGAWRL